MDIVLALVSVGAGFITGWFFERRASNAARMHNDDLKRQVIALKTTILSLGGSQIVEQAPVEGKDLTAEVTQRAIATQGPEGRVDRGALIAHFVEKGFGRSDIEAAISSVCGAGIATEEKSWLRIG